MTLGVLRLAAEEGVDLNPFKPEFGLIVWGGLAFLIVLFVLAKKVFPRLEETLADRERRIKESLSDAEATREQAERLLSDYRTRVAQVREEASKITEEARASAEAIRKEMVTKAEAEAREVLTKAQAQLAGERERVVGELERQLATWSSDIAGRILERELSPQAHRDLVEAFIREVTARPSEAGRA